MQEFFNELIAKDKKVQMEDDEVTFHKEHEFSMISTWCRVRMDDTTPKYQVQGLDGRVLEGAVDKIAESRGSSKKKCTWMDTAWVEEPLCVKANEFFHEAAVSKLVKDYLSDIPVFARGKLVTAQLDTKGGRGWLSFQRVPGVELETVVNDLTVEEMKSVMLQVLVSICVAQDRIKLKHHDLHLFNVLVHSVKPEDATEMHVETPLGIIHFPIVGLHASIIDYGLSSATDPVSGKRYMRLDEDLLTRVKGDSSSDDDEWGVWGPMLEGDTGYDVAMFVESFVEELFRDRPLNIPKLQVIANLQELFDIDFTERGRPTEKSTVDWRRVFEILGAVVESK